MGQAVSHTKCGCHKSWQEPLLGISGAVGDTGTVPVHELCAWDVPGGCSCSGRVKPTGIQVLITQKFLVTHCVPISSPVAWAKRV